MTVVGLHPEELFDKLVDGELSPAERDRLQLHLEGCEVCRFEYAARLDFQAEALELSAAAPPTLPLRPLALPLLEGEPQAALPPVRRRRGRLLVWGLVAATLITASGAVAAGLAAKQSWHPLDVLFSSPQTAPAAGTPTAVKKARPALGQAATASPAATATNGALVAATPSAPDVTASAPPKPENGAARLPHGVKAEPHAAAAPVAQSAAVAPIAKPVAAPIAAVAATPAPKEDVRDAKEAPVAKEPSAAAKLFAEANQARRAGDVGRASGLYHLLQDQYGGSPEAELSRVTLALLLLDSGDAQGALVGFERYLAGPSRGLEAEALVGRARALGRLGRRDLEAAAWQEVQRKYPRSIYGRQATERLAALGLP